MNTKPAVKLINNGERRVPEVQAEVESAADPNRWSASVQSWVSEFQQQGRGKSLPAFDSLFKDAPLQ